MTRTVRLRVCAREGCPTRYDDWDWQNVWPKRYCSMACYLAKPKVGPKPRVPLPRTASARNPRPISVASKEQAAKRNAGASIVSGATEGLDAAHLAPRGFRGGCDSPDCTVPLTREEHVDFDRGRLDLLPYLVAHGCLDEMAHALRHYAGDLPALLERLTGARWIAVERTLRGECA